MEWLCDGAGFEPRKSVYRAPGINAELPHVVNDTASSRFLQGPLHYAGRLINATRIVCLNATPLLGNPPRDSSCLRRRPHKLSHDFPLVF